MKPSVLLTVINVFSPTLLKILSFDVALDCKHITAYQKHNLHLLFSKIYQTLHMHLYSMQLICIVLGFKSCSLHWSQMVFSVCLHGQEPALLWFEIIFTIPGPLSMPLLLLITLMTADHSSLTHHQAEPKISALVQCNSRRGKGDKSQNKISDPLIKIQTRWH